MEDEIIDIVEEHMEAQAAAFGENAGPKPPAWGLASFLIAIVVGFMEFVGFFFWGSVRGASPIDLRAIMGGNMMAAVILLATLGIHFIGGLVGIVALVKREKKMVAIFGVVGNVAMLGGIVILAGLSYILK